MVAIAAGSHYLSGWRVVESRVGDLMMATKDEYLKKILGETNAGMQEKPDTEVLSGKRVLIVDDSKVIRKMFDAQVRKLDMIPVEAENGYAGLTMLRHCHQSRTPVHVVLLDMQMPEMDGMEMLRHMRTREFLKGIPVIMTTTQNELDNVQGCARLGITDYILKPVLPERLRLALRKALGG